MSAELTAGFVPAAPRLALRRIDVGGALLAALTVAAAALWAFPMLWAGFRVFGPSAGSLTPEALIENFFGTQLGLWHLNSLIVASSVTLVVLVSGGAVGYALSQLSFPGRRLLWFVTIASFVVPVQALIISHFFQIAGFGLIDTLPGIILPQLVVPIVVIVYKLFFDAVPVQLREAAQLDGASHFQLLGRIYLPINWAVTAVLGFVTFIGAWNAFLWPFLASIDSSTLTATVGITQANGDFAATVLFALVACGVMFPVLRRQLLKARGEK